MPCSKRLEIQAQANSEDSEIDSKRLLVITLRWPFDKKDVDDLSTALERLKSNLNLALTSDLVCVETFRTQPSLITDPVTVRLRFRLPESLGKSPRVSTT